MALFGLFAILSNTALAQEPTRFALLIGNQGYSPDVGPLKNTHQDIEVVGTALKKLGFEIVSLPDADYRQMDIAIRRHVRQVRDAGPGAVSFVYYSGHGIANPNTGNNYLVPVDVEKADTDNIWDESFEQSLLIDRLNRQAPQAIHFIVLDACRNELNLTSSGTKALGAEKGFRPVNDVRGMLIAYATAERQTAADTGDFARILAEEIVRPGSEAVSAFRRVQLRVEQTLGQEPWMSLRYLPQTYLAGKETAPPPAPPPEAEPPLSEAAQAWRAVQDTRSEAVLERFIREFPGSVYAGFAEARLEELRTLQALGTSEHPKTGSVVLFDNVLLTRNENKLYRDVDVALSLQSIASRSARVVVNQQSLGIAFGERKIFCHRDVTCDLVLMETDLEGGKARFSIACKR